MVGRRGGGRIVAAPRNTLRAVVSLVRRASKRSPGPLRMGVAVGRRGARRGPVLARGRRRRPRHAVDRRPLLHDDRAAGCPTEPASGSGRTCSVILGIPVWALWTIAAVALAIGEVFTPGLFFLGPLAVAALVAGLVAALASGVAALLAFIGAA